jgi:hypothetical protein
MIVGIIGAPFYPISTEVDISLDWSVLSISGGCRGSGGEIIVKLVPTSDQVKLKKIVLLLLFFYGWVFANQTKDYLCFYAYFYVFLILQYLKLNNFIIFSLGRFCRGRGHHLGPL